MIFPSGKPFTTTSVSGVMMAPSNALIKPSISGNAALVMSDPLSPSYGVVDSQSVDTATMIHLDVEFVHFSQSGSALLYLASIRILLRRLA
nr:hypothetical protein [Synechocystis sp. LEGE 06083]